MRILWTRWLRSLPLHGKKSRRRDQPSQNPRLEHLEERLAPATYIWTGASSVDNKWSTKENWQDNIAPDGVPDFDGGERLSFLNNAAQKTNENNIVGGTFAEITISGDSSLPGYTPYVLSGEKINVASTDSLGNILSGGSITVNGRATNTRLLMDINLAGRNADQTFINVVEANADLRLEGKLSDNPTLGVNVELVKQGAGTLVLANDNSALSGTITAQTSSGFLRIEHALALGDTTSGTVIAQNSQLQVGPGIGGDINETLKLSGPGPDGSGALLNFSGNNTWAGNIVLDADVTLGANVNTQLTIVGQISDSAGGWSLTKEGNGTIVFASANTYRKLTTINHGTLVIRDPLALGPVGGGNAGRTIVNSSPTTGAGTLAIEFVGLANTNADAILQTPGLPFHAIDNPVVGYRIRNEILELNGLGYDASPDVPSGTQTLFTDDPGALSNVSGRNNWWGNVILGSTGMSAADAHVAIGVEAGSELIISGVVSTPNVLAPLSKVRAGKLVLNNSNTYASETFVRAGVLNIRDSRALGTSAGGTTVSAFTQPGTNAYINVDAALELEVETDPATRFYAPGAGGFPATRDLWTDSITGLNGNGPQSGLRITEPLTLIGRGIGNTGALRSVSGINTLKTATGLSLTSSGPAFPDVGIGVDADPNQSNTNNYFTNDYSLTILAPSAILPALTGGANWHKDGTGHLILPNASDYTGITNINNGWITVQNVNSLGGFITGGDTIQRGTVVNNGGSLHLKPITAGASFQFLENLTLNGQGMTHAFSLINQKGALMSLGGNNVIGGPVDLGAGGIRSSDITLSGIAGIGVELLEPSTFSSLTITASILETAGQLGGITKLGSRRLTLQGDGAYGGNNEIREGVLRVQHNSALGVRSTGTSTGSQTYTQSTTTVGAGIAEVQSITVTGTTNPYQLVLNGQATVPIAWNAPATSVVPYTVDPSASVQNALLDLLLNKLAIPGATVNVTKAGNVYAVTFGGSLFGLNLSQMTQFVPPPGGPTPATATVRPVVDGDGAALELAPGIELTSGGISTGLAIWNEKLVLGGTGNFTLGSSGQGVSALTVLSGDNMWHGPVELTSSAAVQVRPDARITVVGALSDTTVSNLVLTGGTGVAEVQNVTVNGVAGDFFTLTFNGEITRPIPFGADQLVVQQELNRLATIGGIGAVTPGGEGGFVTVIRAGSNYEITFKGSLFGSNQNAITGSAHTGTPTFSYPGLGAIDGSGGIGGKLGLAGAVAIATPFKGTVIARQGTIELRHETALGISTLSERQSIEVTGPTAGTSFTLTFNGVTTPTPLLADSATLASDIQTALNNLASIKDIGGLVTVVQNGTKYEVTFGGTLQGFNQPQLIATPTGTTVDIVNLRQGSGGTVIENGASLALEGNMNVSGEPLIVQGQGDGSSVSTNGIAEVQTISIATTATGTFTLTFNGVLLGTFNTADTPATIAGQIQSLLRGATFNNGVVVTTAPSGGNNVYTVTFGGSLTGFDQNQLVSTPTTGSMTPVNVLTLFEGYSAGVSEVQRITVPAAAGTFTLTFNGSITGPINSALPTLGSDIQAALNHPAMTSIQGVGGVASVRRVLVSEVQTLSIPTAVPTDGTQTFTLRAFGLGVGQAQTITVGNDTQNITRIQSAIVTLAGLAGFAGVTAADVTVTSVRGTLDFVYTVTFGGPLSGINHALMVTTATAPGGTAIPVSPKTDGVEQFEVTFGGTLRGSNQPMITSSLPAVTIELLTDGAAASPGWFPVGPAGTNNGQTKGNQAVSGRVTGVVVDRLDANVIYITTAGGGAWKTKDSGRTWVPLFDSSPVHRLYLPADAGSFTLSFDGAPAVTLSYVATDLTDGTLRAAIENALNGMSTINSGAAFRGRVEVVQSPLNRLVFQIRYLGTLSGTTPIAGRLVATGLAPIGDPLVTVNSPVLNASAIAMDPNDPRILYVGTGEGNNSVDSFYGSGVYKSVDSGRTWNLLTNADGTNPVAGLGITKIVVDPGIDDRTAAGTYPNTTGGVEPGRNPDTTGPAALQTPQGRIYVSTTGDVTNRQSGSVHYASLTDAGTGYTYNPDSPYINFNFNGGGGAGASGYAVVDPSGSISGVFVTNWGSGYTSAPTFTVPGGTAKGVGFVLGQVGVYRFEESTQRVQTLTLPTRNGGTSFLLTFGGETTGAEVQTITIPTATANFSLTAFGRTNATVANSVAGIRTAIVNLANTPTLLFPVAITAADVAVTSVVAGPNTIYTVKFVGNLNAINHAPMTSGTGGVSISTTKNGIAFDLASANLAGDIQRELNALPNSVANARSFLVYQSPINPLVFSIVARSGFGPFPSADPALVTPTWFAGTPTTLPLPVVTGSPTWINLTAIPTPARMTQVGQTTPAAPPQSIGPEDDFRISFPTGGGATWSDLSLEYFDINTVDEPRVAGVGRAIIPGNGPRVPVVYAAVGNDQGNLANAVYRAELPNEAWDNGFATVWYMGNPGDKKSEIQTITLDSFGPGTIYQLGFRGVNTPVGMPLVGNEPTATQAQTIEDALNALSTIGGVGGRVTVTLQVNPPPTITQRVYIVTFGGTMANSPQPLITSIVAPTGGSWAVTHASTQAGAGIDTRASLFPTGIYPPTPNPTNLWFNGTIKFTSYTRPASGLIPDPAAGFYWGDNGSSAGDPNNQKYTDVFLYAMVMYPEDLINYPTLHGQLRFIYKSVDGGNSWTEITGPANPAGTQGWYNSVILARNDLEVYLGGHEASNATHDQFIYRVTDGGSGGANTWADIIFPNNTGPHTSAHAMTIDRNGSMLVGTDGGLWRYNPGAAAGSQWTDLNGNLATALIVNVAGHPSSLDIAFAGTRFNGLQAFTGNTDGQAWRMIDSATARDGGQVVSAPGSPLTLYYLSNTTNQAPTNSNLRKSTDGGVTWNPINTLVNGTGGTTSNIFIDGAPTPDVSRYTPIVVDSVETDRVLVGGFFNSVTALNGVQLQESLDGGATWRNLNLPTFPHTPPEVTSSRSVGAVTGIALAVNQGSFQPDLGFPSVVDKGSSSYVPGTIYVSHLDVVDRTYRVFVTKNNGVNWVNRTPAGFGSRTIVDIQVDPSNQDTAYIVVGGTSAGFKVFKTIDAGRNWSNISNNLPNLPVYKLVLDPRSGDVYLGTDNGVWLLPSGSTVWTRFGVGMPNVAVRDLELNITNNSLLAGTYGRSVYQLFLADGRPNAGALRAVSGNTKWSGQVQLVGDVANPVTISADGTQALQNGVATASLEISGKVVDRTPGSNTTLIKTGQGDVTLSGSNLYGGQTDVREGSLIVANAKALGAPVTGIPASDGNGTVVRSGAALEISTDLAEEWVTLNGNGVQPGLNGHNTGALRNVSGNNTFTGQLFLNTDTTVGVDTGSSLTIGAKTGLAGTGTILDAIGATTPTLVKELTGRLILAGANSYTGLTEVRQGELQVQHDQALGGTINGTSVLDGAQLEISLPAGSLATGVKIVDEALALRGTGVSNTGAIENLMGENEWEGGLISLLTAQVSFGVLTGSKLTVDSEITGAGSSLIKVGGGAVILQRTNTYTGVTNVDEGAVVIQRGDTVPGENGTLGTTGNGTVVKAGAAVQLDGTGGDVTVDEAIELNGTGTDGTGALRNLVGNNVWLAGTPIAHPIRLGSDTTIAADAGSTLTVNADVRDPVALLVPAPSLTKLGTGTVIFPTAKTYNGKTFVNEGVLNIRHAGALGDFEPETQTVTVSGASGTFTLQYGLGGSIATGDPGSNTTIQLDIQDVLAQADGPGEMLISSALNALDTIKGIPGPGNGSVTVTKSGSVFTVTFGGGYLAESNVVQLIATGSVIAEVATTRDGPEGTFVADGATLEVENVGGGPITTEALTITGNGFGGRGALNNVAGINTWSRDITLTGNATIGSVTGSLTLDQRLVESGGTRAVTKVGEGTVVYAGTVSNAYTGLTTVNAGTLELAKTGGAVAVNGNLTIGDGVITALPAKVSWTQGNQVVDSAMVVVKSDGLLELNDGLAETVLNLKITDGDATIGGTGAALTLGDTSTSLDMTGGKITIADTGKLVLNGNIAATASATETAQIVGDGAGDIGSLDLNGVPRTLNVARSTEIGAPLTDLRIGTTITQTGAETLTKAGNGKAVIDLDGVFAGLTNLLAGELQADGMLGDIEVDTNATLSGNGVVGKVTGIVGSGVVGTIAPGDSTIIANPAGELETGDSKWGASTIFAVDLVNGNSNPMTSVNDRIKVTSGNIDITDAVLQVNAIDSLPGDVFTIIQVDAGTVTGQFFNAKDVDGVATVFFAGKKYEVDYTDPTKVVLRRVLTSVTLNVTATPVTPTKYGQKVEYTITIAAEPGATPINPTEDITLVFEGGTPFTRQVGTGTITYDPGLLAVNDLGNVTYTLDVSYNTPTVNPDNEAKSFSINHVVEKATPKIKIVPVPSPATYGDTVSVSVDVFNELADPDLPPNPNLAPGTLKPTGSVDITVDSVTTNVLLVNGHADLPLTNLQAGVQTISVTYIPAMADPNYLGTTDSKPVTINKADPTISLGALPAAPQNRGVPVTLTATLSGPTAPTAGSVAFYYSFDTTFDVSDVLIGTDSTFVAGMAANESVASYTTSSLMNGSDTLPAGIQAIFAVYSGDSNFNTRTSTALPYTVNPAAVTVVTTVAAGSNSPSRFSEPVTFQADVTSNLPVNGVPTGKVKFTFSSVGHSDRVFDNITLTALDADTSRASFPISDLAVGTWTVVAEYTDNVSTPSAQYATMSDQLDVDHIVQLALTTTTLDPLTASSAGQVVTLRAVVQAEMPGGGVPLGTVTFFLSTNGSAPVAIGTQTLVGASATSSATTLQYAFLAASTAPNSYVLTATYNPSGSASHLTSSTLTGSTQTVNKSGSNIVILSRTPSNPVYGDSITVNFRVDPVIPAPVATTAVAPFQNPLKPSTTVMVSVDVPGYPAQMVTLANGVGTVVLPGLGAKPSPDFHTLTFTYAGDTNYNAATPVTRTVSIAKATPILSFPVASNPTGSVPRGTPVTLTVLVDGPPVDFPTGQVNFFWVNGVTLVPLGTGNINPTTGLATVTTSALPAGVHLIRATYAGDPNWLGTDDAVALNNPNLGLVHRNVTIGPAPTEIKAEDFTITPTSSVFGNTVTIQVKVSSKVPSDPVAMVGQVVFTLTSNNGQPRITSPAITLVNGVASFTISAATSSQFTQATPPDPAPSSFNAGTWTIEAKYTNLPPSNNTDPFADTVATKFHVVNQANTKTTLVSQKVKSIAGEVITYTATVVPTIAAPGLPTGSVTFFRKVGAAIQALGQVPVVNENGVMVARLPIRFNQAGAFPMFAIYNGESPNFLPSDSRTTAAVTQTVIQYATVTTITRPRANAVFRETMTFTVTVRGGLLTGPKNLIPNNGTPSRGSVSIWINGRFYRALALNAVGQASFPVRFNNVTAPNAPFQIMAIYNPAAPERFYTSRTTVPQGVVKATPKILSAGPIRQVYVGQVTQLRTVIGTYAPGTGVPIGQVVFRVDGVNRAPVNVVTQVINGVAYAVANFNVPSLAAGNHTLQVIHLGSSTYNAVGSAVSVFQVRNPAKLTAAASATGTPTAGTSLINLTAIARGADNSVANGWNGPTTVTVVPGPGNAPIGATVTRIVAPSKFTNGVVQFQLRVNRNGLYRFRIYSAGLFVDVAITVQNGRVV